MIMGPFDDVIPKKRQLEADQDISMQFVSDKILMYVNASLDISVYPPLI